MRFGDRETQHAMSDTIKSFRFQKIREHVLNSLEDSTLYFAAPPTLNDPHDCQINIRAAITRAIPNTSRKRQALLREILRLDLIAKIQQDIPNMGVCCFSKRLSNSLMWSHYADSHKGVSLYYEIPTVFLGPNQILGWAPVIYRNNPLTHWLVNEIDEDLDAAHASMEIMKRVLTMKSKAWSYEEEGRLLRLSSGPLEIPREFLKTVCFGLNTSDADKQTLIKIIFTSYENVQIVKMIPDSDADTGVCPVVETLPMA